MGNPLDVQVGGNHYKKYEYQPIEFINDLNLSFIQGNIIKYIVRHNDKNGIQDIDKAIHYCELAIQLECITNLSMSQINNANKFILQFEDDFIKQCISNVLVGNWKLIIKMCKNKIKI